MTAELTVKFNLTRNDYLTLKGTIGFLESIKDEFSKCGTCSTEVELLEGTAHLLDEILRGEVF